MKFLVTDLETVGLPQAGEWFDPVEPDARLKDPIKVAESIAEKTAARNDKFGLDPDCNRIVALGWVEVGSNQPVCHLAKDENEEREGLKLFWDAYKSHPGQQETRLVTFYGHSFDLPVLMRRSWYLDVKCPELVLKPDWKCVHKDVWERLATGYPRKAHGLQFYRKRLGLPIDDAISGADVGRLYQEGTPEAWALIARHCMADIETTHVLAERLGMLNGASL